MADLFSHHRAIGIDRPDNAEWSIVFDCGSESATGGYHVLTLQQMARYSMARTSQVKPGKITTEESVAVERAVSTDGPRIRTQRGPDQAEVPNFKIDSASSAADS